MALFKIVIWAMIFLTKLRFPPGISIATVLKNQLCYNWSFADLLQLVETICYNLWITSIGNRLFNVRP